MANNTDVLVRAPASSANLGSAFDVGAIAVALHNEVRAALSAADTVTVAGEGATALDAGARNLTLVALDRFYSTIGRPRPPLALQFVNRIPFGRGLGSSAAALAAGLRLGEALSGVTLDEQALLSLAADLEGHGDNTTAALLGGFTLCVRDGKRLTAVRLATPPDLRIALFVPDYAVATAEARAVLPATLPRADAVYNVGRATLLAAAFATGDFRLLAVAMQDRLHQPYRLPLYRGMQRLLDAARAAGAFGAAVSGAGPSAVAVTDATHAAPVASALEREARGLGVSGRALNLAVDPHGAGVVREPASSPL